MTLGRPRPSPAPAARPTSTTWSSLEDLVALTIESAAMARVPLAGTDWIPGTPGGRTVIAVVGAGLVRGHGLAASARRGHEVRLIEKSARRVPASARGTAAPTARSLRIFPPLPYADPLYVGLTGEGCVASASPAHDSFPLPCCRTTGGHSTSA
ncbi:hypothetical protein ACRAWF_46335 [Streptomyces sp. L7]